MFKKRTQISVNFHLPWIGQKTLFLHVCLFPLPSCHQTQVRNPIWQNSVQLLKVLQICKPLILPFVHAIAKQSVQQFFRASLPILKFEDCPKLHGQQWEVRKLYCPGHAMVDLLNLMHCMPNKAIFMGNCIFQQTPIIVFHKYWLLIIHMFYLKYDFVDSAVVTHILFLKMGMALILNYSRMMF